MSSTAMKRTFGRVVIAGAAAFFDLYAPQSILPQLAADFRVSTHQVGWVITVTTFAVALIGPFAGALADVLGRKRLIVAGALAMVVPTLLAAVATVTTLRAGGSALTRLRASAGPRHRSRSSLPRPDRNR